MVGSVINGGGTARTRQESDWSGVAVETGGGISSCSSCSSSFFCGRGGSLSSPSAAPPSSPLRGAVAAVVVYFDAFHFDQATFGDKVFHDLVALGVCNPKKVADACDGRIEPQLRLFW